MRAKYKIYIPILALGMILTTIMIVHVNSIISNKINLPSPKKVYAESYELSIWQNPQKGECLLGNELIKALNNPENENALFYVNIIPYYKSQKMLDMYDSYIYEGRTVKEWQESGGNNVKQKSEEAVRARYAYFREFEKKKLEYSGISAMIKWEALFAFLTKEQILYFPTGEEGYRLFLYPKSDDQ